MKLMTLIILLLTSIPAFAQIDWLGYNQGRPQGPIRESAQVAGEATRFGYGLAANGIYHGSQIVGSLTQAAGNLVPGPGGVLLEKIGRAERRVGSQIANTVDQLGYLNEQVINNAGNIAASATENVAGLAVNTLSSTAQLGRNVTEQSLRNAQFIIEGQRIPGQNLYPVFARPASRAIIAGSRRNNNALESIIFNSSLIADRLARIGVNLPLQTLETIIRVGQTAEQISWGISRELALYGVNLPVQTIEVVVRESSSYIPVGQSHHNHFQNYLGHVAVIVVYPGSCQMILNNQVLSTINYPQFP